MVRLGALLKTAFFLSVLVLLLIGFFGWFGLVSALCSLGVWLDRLLDDLFRGLV